MQFSYSDNGRTIKSLVLKHVAISVTVIRSLVKNEVNDEVLGYLQCGFAGR